MTKKKKGGLNPWITKKQKVVYKNPWIKVREDKVVRPDGKDGIYGVVQISDGVGIVAIDKDNNVLLIGEWRYPISKYSWSIICGTCEGNERPLSAAKKELIEEASMKAKNWQHLVTFHPSPGILDETAHIFLATDLADTIGVQEGTTKIRVKKVPFTKALDMIKKGKITDSYAIIGLLSAKEKLINA
jgi:8-oxo-dGTP pyrophosphatase MutT (NUDIX family)